MLVVKVELWPFGNREKAELLGVAHIVNDGTGTDEIGNYKVRIASGVDANSWWKQGHVKGVRRGRDRLWELVQKALSSCGLTSVCT